MREPGLETDFKDKGDPDVGIERMPERRHVVCRAPPGQVRRDAAFRKAVVANLHQKLKRRRIE